MSLEDNKIFDNAIGLLKDKWKKHEELSNLLKQMETLGKNMKHLRGSNEIADKKKMRIVWQKAIQQYWDIVWGIVEAKIDEDGTPPEELVFDQAERLFIDFGHLYSDYTTPNDEFFVQLDEEASVDMYQYNRLTDYIRESYALIFMKPYTGTSSGISIDDKKVKFANELTQTQRRRRMVITTLFSQFSLASIEDISTMLKSLEDGLSDSVESDMRTRRIREADEAQRKTIRDHCRKYEDAERTLYTMLDQLERTLTKADDPKKEEEESEEAEEAATEVAAPQEEAFDPFAEIGSEDEAPKLPPAPIIIPEEDEAETEEAPAEESEETAESLNAKSRQEDKDAVDQSLKIIQNVLSLHDRTKFLASMIVHVQNEGERWKRRVEMATKKYKGQGVPALKLELREGLNNKKDFMMLCGRQSRVDVSPLCQNKNKPMSMKRCGEVMMDLTPLDPDMLRASRIRMYGIPRVIMVPGQGLGVYDWSDNSLIIPIFSVVSDVKAIAYALAAFRWDNDEDRTLKDTFALLKQNKGKGIRGLQDQFSNDYYLWISFERKGYRKLKKDVSKWFKAFFKQKTASGGQN